MNLRERMATGGLKVSIEGNYGLPVELITPDGVTITTNEDGDPLKGQVLYDRDGIDPETGDMIVVKETKVTLRRTALSRIPLPGEIWQIKIPENPSLPDILTQFFCNADDAPMGGQSIGFITLKLKDVDQS